MAVYVDDMNLRAAVPGGGRVVRGRWSHLFADTEAELRAFATRIGLRPGWIQHPGQPHVHFDVTARMRQRALAAGAVPVTWRQAGGFFAHRTRPAAAGRGQALRRAAHLYLGHGLEPVPAWGATPGDACQCPRGAACPRPGKHPRSVHVGPGERDYSWKPLTCHIHQQIDVRFADGGAYAAGNLMLAIPPGMLVIDQDDDDGGPQAIAALAARLGGLPATLTHHTPHGCHRIYATPPGWAGRAWVGKDTRNPLPPGIDLRVPGQILMAPPSHVPAGGGLAAYRLPTPATVAALPAAYLTAWTPPQTQAPRPRQAVPVPPDRADAAAAYVHARITGIAADLAAREPGGRNTAIYTAALKAGSTLGAASATPGAEHAAHAWDGQAAEDALMAAAEANGYTAAHGTAAARSAIRSGLRNGLRDPRPLPDFTAAPARQPRTARAHRQPHRRTRQATPAPATEAASETTAGTPSADQRGPGEPAHTTAAVPAAGYQATSPAAGPRTATPQGQQPPAAVTPERARRAAQAAAAADEAYHAGDFARARQLISHAAGLDPSRAGLWATCHREIAAKQLLAQAAAARQDGDHDRAAALTEQCRQLDPRLEARWHRHLTGTRHGRITHREPAPGAERAAGHDRNHPRPAPQPARPAAEPVAGNAWGSRTGPRQPGTSGPNPGPATTRPQADRQPAGDGNRPAAATQPAAPGRHPHQLAAPDGERIHDTPRPPEHHTPGPGPQRPPTPAPAAHPEAEQEACG